MGQKYDMTVTALANASSLHSFLKISAAFSPRRSSTSSLYAIFVDVLDNQDRVVYKGRSSIYLSVIATVARTCRAAEN
jgi:hypothetical protein